MEKLTMVRDVPGVIRHNLRRLSLSCHLVSVFGGNWVQLIAPSFFIQVLNRKHQRKPSWISVRFDRGLLFRDCVKCFVFPDDSFNQLRWTFTRSARGAHPVVCFQRLARKWEDGQWYGPRVSVTWLFMCRPRFILECLSQGGHPSHRLHRFYVVKFLTSLM